MKQYFTRKRITKKECPWLDKSLPKGLKVYPYYGATYGCVSPSGIAVTLVDDQTPFFEIPRIKLLAIEVDELPPTKGKEKEA